MQLPFKQISRCLCVGIVRPPTRRRYLTQSDHSECVRLRNSYSYANYTIIAEPFSFVRIYSNFKWPTYHTHKTLTFYIYLSFGCVVEAKAISLFGCVCAKRGCWAQTHQIMQEISSFPIQMNDAWILCRVLSYHTTMRSAQVTSTFIQASMQNYCLHNDCIELTFSQSCVVFHQQ